MVTYALFALNCFNRERYHSHNAQHSPSRPTTHKHSMQSEPSTLSSTTCTASCHLVACADSAAAEAVSDAATTAEFSPASSGYRRRAWNKRYDDRRERAERRSLRPPIVSHFLANGDEPREASSIPARSYRMSVQEIHRGALRTRGAAANATQRLVVLGARKSRFSQCEGGT